MTAIRSVFVCVLFIAIGLPLVAQTVVTLGQATSNNVFPFRFSGTGSGRYQTAYTNTEINVPGGSQLIEIRVRECTQAGFQIPVPPGPGTYDNLRIRVAHTTNNPFGGMTGTFDTNYIPASMVTCFGPANFAPAYVGGYFVFPLTTPFVYNATQNMLVDWSFDSRTGVGFYIHSVGTRQRIYTFPGTYQSTAGSASTAGDWEIQFVYLTGPGITVVANVGAAKNVYANAQGPGSLGVDAGRFSITANSQGSVVMDTVELSGSGTGDDSTAYSEVTLYRDADSDNQFNAAVDTIAVSAPGNFAVDDGTVTLNLISSEQFIGANDSRTYFVVVRLASMALPGHTLKFGVADIAVTGGSKSGLPSAVMEGLVIDPPLFDVVDSSSPTPVQALLSSTGNVCQEFTIGYPNGPPDRPSNLSVSSLGTADESTDVVDVQLWWDADASGSFNSTSDSLVDTQIFVQDNGVVDFDLTSHPVFQPGQVRRFFVVYNLNTNANNLETFQCYVSALSGAPLGGTATGLPAPGLNGTAGLEVSANVLVATLNGPVAAATVNSNFQGGGDGALLCDVTLSAAPGTGWTVSTLTFNASGTGVHDTAYQQVALYEDDSSGTWDGAAIDTLAAATLTGFSGGVATFTLAQSSFPASSSRRFFLTGKLNGTAVSGQTFNAALQSASAMPATTGTTSGIPTLASTALIIDTAALTVGNGPNQPAAATHKGGAPGSYTIAQFRVFALNGPATVNSIALTTGGTGNWTTDVDATTGVQVYRDDGDGAFSGAADTLLFSGAGGGVVTATFTSPLNLGVSTTADLWVRVGFTPAAGIGALATPETFTLSIANPMDVSSTSTVLLGTPAPSGVILGAIEFAITSFVPTSDLPKGGKAITIQGSGFQTPFSVRIGGVICPGTPAISTGTQVTGLLVPPGGGEKLMIEINSGNLPTQVLANTFTYSSVGSTGNGSSGSGCSGQGGGVAMLAVLALLGVVATRRRRTA
jgi:hypothetical protein